MGRYRVAAELARGGMGQVFLAKLGGPDGLEPPVVVKRILPHHASEPAFRKMFRDEARALIHVRHPNVVQLVDVSVDGDELFLAMEYVEGESLTNVCQALQDREIWIDYATAIRFVAEAAAGAHAAHVATDEHGRALRLVHRDISPQNVMVTYGGHVKLVDFGIAKSRDSKTTTGHVKGKYAYMAPEQCVAGDVDARTDVFALGILLYELTTGLRLFSRANELLTLRAICEDPIPRPRPPSGSNEPYPPALAAIVRKALERKPSDRYASAGELRRELNVLLRELDADGRLEERVGALMTELFRDRMEAKRQMLRDVELGTTVSALPRPDLRLETPSAPSDVAPDAERSRITSSALPRSRSAWPLALGVLMIAGAGAWAVVQSPAASSSAEAPATAPTAASAEVPTEAAPPAAPDPAPPAEPGPALAEPDAVLVAAPDAPTSAVPQQVQLTVTSVPPGAEILLDGARLGITPLDVRVDAHAEAQTLELSLAGHLPSTQSISLARDSRVHVAMRRRAGRREQGRSRSGTPTSFGRFD